VTRHPNLRDVYAARRRIVSMVRHTPLRDSAGLSEKAGVPVRLKLENRQETGSFKLRGAASAILSLTDEERMRGVVAVSSGNHGRAVAKVAADVGAKAVICLSSRVPAVKTDAIAGLGAEVVVAGPTQDDADAEARRLVAERGLTFVHPFDDPRVIAGQGTVGIELLETFPELDCAIVPLSGGGLISGIAIALKSADPAIRVVGVSQDRGPAMYDSIEAGRLTDVVEEDTLADALAGGLGPENHHTFEMCRDLLDDIVLVSEDDMADAMAWLSIEEGESVEGGGAVGVAAVLQRKISLEGPTAVVVSGGNVGADALAAIVEGRR
jgi:threonine dehydratase